MQAARGGRVDVLKQLLDYGANVPVALLQSPQILQPAKALLKKHLITFVLQFVVL